ncbi:MAG: type III-A CRISPR-associated RAMP protein Csm4 [Desmonostoc vinosum HA7617-LM4]|jgi:CRISPR-associated protein Csm4|nr:type III-A CRISPR-associated RAMP protein Csm4 [Desmonostoc vinosum HA7617-LM4]
MSVWKLVKLNFGRSPAHFGEVGIGIEETSDRIRSDSLFSAWISAYARLFSKHAVEELLQKFPTPEQSNLIPPFRISSTFIYRQASDRTIYYLPRPLKFPHNYPDDDLKFFKTYKKLNYLPLEVWQRWYQGQGFEKDADTDELIAYTTNGKSQGELNKLGTFEYKKSFKIDKVPKIAVDRVTRATNLYHTGFVQFEWDKNPSGLYFLLQLSQEGEKLVDKLEAALHFLGEEGIGGERSSGAGRFQLEWLELPETWQQVVNSDGTHHTLMSLFWESSIPDEFLNNACYEIQERGGWIAESQLRRQMVRMFSEGSVFLTSPQGKLINVTPHNFNKHNIYRSGISLSLPIQAQDK